MFSGYLTREGEFMDVSGYKITPDESAHNVFCDAYGYVEEELMEVRGWVKLTICLPHEYIYYKYLGLLFLILLFLQLLEVPPGHE